MPVMRSNTIHVVTTMRSNAIHDVTAMRDSVSYDMDWLKPVTGIARE